jgi:hypothetical protein
MPWGVYGRRRLSARLCLMMPVFMGLIDARNSDTAFLGQVTEIPDDMPHPLIAEDSFPTRHPAEADAVLNNPFQLAIGVFL